ncbi:MAG TPA: transketolase [Candidatus Saccharimonadales bacterium]|nr:transketolase [Candidatus Saccharimonadales bacterium]
MSKDMDNLCINTIRMLSADAVQKANSGHPGLPMGAAAFAYVLWMRHLRFNPQNPDWLNRDRFVLSAGHGSMLLYSLLHLTGYDLPLSELKRFRQWGSKTPGHPEHGLTPGVETTTGPLGQGAANAVGMALAERFLADRYNKPDHEIIDYRTYALVSDGDLMEGISAEAASFAGSAKLGKLTYLYDSNRISIEGSTDLTFLENVGKRFKAYGWHVVNVKDGNDTRAVNKALSSAKKDARPSLIILNTHIGFGSPNKHDSASAHGSPLGEEEVLETKKNLGWPVEPAFFIPREVSRYMGRAVEAGILLENTWNRQFELYAQEFPAEAKELKALTAGKRSKDWQKHLPAFSADEKPMATREASGAVMNAVAPVLPLFLGGSADLGPSNNTALKEFGDVSGPKWDKHARNLHFGVREHAMGAILNGLALSKAIIPYGGTFLIFSDYMRASMRLAAIMKLQTVYVLTHDSIGQGEDGTTHQPVEQLAALRAMPNMTVIRPSDATETVEAWRHALDHATGPTALSLTRQKLPVLDRKKLAKADNLKYGGYVIKDCKGTPDIILIATGSEVCITLDAAEELSKQGVKARVVSMPSTDIFDSQPQKYKDSVLPPTVTKRLAVEAASPLGWDRYIGPEGATITIDKFGDSAPGPVMMEKFGFTPANIVKQANKLLGKKS